MRPFHSHHLDKVPPSYEVSKRELKFELDPTSIESDQASEENLESKLTYKKIDFIPLLGMATWMKRNFNHFDSKERDYNDFLSGAAFLIAYQLPASSILLTAVDPSFAYSNHNF